MNRFYSHSLAALAAVVLAFGSIGTIVSVPPATASVSSGLIALA